MDEKELELYLGDLDKETNGELSLSETAVVTGVIDNWFVLEEYC